MLANFAEGPRLRRARFTGLEQGAPLSANARARVCGKEGCSTRLSRYNPGETCSTHAGWRDVTNRSR